MCVMMTENIDHRRCLLTRGDHIKKTLLLPRSSTTAKFFLIFCYFLFSCLLPFPPCVAYFSSQWMIRTVFSGRNMVFVIFPFKHLLYKNTRISCSIEKSENPCWIFGEFFYVTVYLHACLIKLFPGYSFIS